MGPVNYNNCKLRIGAAFVSGLYMLIHATKFDVYRAITSPRFYFVLAISCVVALILIEYVHYMTKKLDHRYGWRSQLSTRIIWQTIYGIIIPGILDLFLIGIYFHFLGENILDNGYFQIDFPMVIIFLLILNGYYFIHYHLLTEERKVQRRVLELTQENHLGHDSGASKEPKRINVNELSETVDDSTNTTENHHIEKYSDENLLLYDNRDILRINYGGIMAGFHVDRDIIYFYRKDRKMFAVTIHGNTYPFKMNIDELLEKYNHLDLCQINRTVVVNCRMIRGYASGEERGRYIIILKPPFRENISIENENHFKITKEYIESLKLRFEMI